MKKYPIVPGRGLNTADAVKYRLEHLETQRIKTAALAETDLETTQIRHNIESFIGSVSIPLGLAGPLLFREGRQEEMVYAPVGTLEGALVASMNRGARVVSESGGFRAAVIHQKMTRSPMFIFNNLAECVQFKNWIEQRFSSIKQIAEQYSNHAVLQSILPFIIGKSVQLKFVYTTGDAAGQNMTTSCTWHAVLWINQFFTKEKGIEAVHFVIEGNGASDKKVSHFSMNHGRGVHVIAECELDHHVIEKVLRVNPDDFIRCMNQSLSMSKLDGMIGFNINVVNAIAAIFVATGQDLACIHESGLGILNIEKTERGLYCSLSLPTLVIGTLGGGTHLPKQREALEMMGCQGAGKLPRLAQLIAGFALALEISTFAAIVGGQFAKAHEKLGRNKPKNWLVKGEVNREFVRSCMNGHLGKAALLDIRFSKKMVVENGIIIDLTSCINKKLTGFLSLEMDFQADHQSPVDARYLLLKSKPLDLEVIKGLHFMAASIDPTLADLISEYQAVTEYKNCHRKEIQLYELLDAHGQSCMPQFLGSKVDAKREIYVFLQELLDYDQLQIINAENEPWKWKPAAIELAIKTIDEVHVLFSEKTFQQRPKELTVFEPWKAKPLYRKFIQIVMQEYEDRAWGNLPPLLLEYLEDLEVAHDKLQLDKTMIHNDFNPRNVALRNNGAICIYDWELAMINFPHRDVVEWLSFVLPENFTKEDLENYLRYHFNLQQEDLDWADWRAGYVYALKEYLVTRVSFYLTGKILMDFAFAERIFLNAMKMIEYLEQ